MEDLQTLIEQVVFAICTQARALDEVRYRLFVDWLKAHSSQVKAASHCHTAEAPVAIQDEESIENSLRSGLKLWFQSLSVRGLLWEYQLIVGEMNWWCDVDELSLARILKAEKKEYQERVAGE